MERYIVLFTENNHINGIIKATPDYIIFHSTNRLKSYLKMRFMFKPWDIGVRGEPQESVKLIKVFNTTNGKVAKFKVPEKALLEDELWLLSCKKIRQLVSTYIDKKLKKIVG